MRANDTDTNAQDKPRTERLKPTAEERHARALRNLEISKMLADAPDSLDMDRGLTCVFFGGGARPIDASTLWRGVKAGRFPPPDKLNRWNLGECRRAIARNAET